MKKGDIVNIYEQPLSETKFEGDAKLLSFIKTLSTSTGRYIQNMPNVELWRVKFLSDGAIVDRAIKTGDK